jgi:RNA polymerase sigma factor (sigma-70 family)
MASHPLQDFLRRLRRARSVTEGGHLSDAQLLERFAARRDEAAFEVLVWRHGPLVLNLARRLLRQSADAEDVFQATFLTLARKASAIRRGTALGSWLYKVAYRLALRLRRIEARRERGQGTELATVAAPAEQGDAELAALLAEEVDRLPERCRAVVVLCYLQGATTEEAARQLGCPRGTVLSRLSSARQRLRQRLLKRGIAPALALAVVSFGETAPASPSAALVAGVMGAALPFAAGRVVLPMVSTQAAALARGALQTMLWNKIKIAGAMACILALAGSGVGWMAGGRGGAESSPVAAAPPEKKEAARPAAAEQEDSTKKEIAKLYAQMEDLAQREHFDDNEWNEKAIKAQLELADAQDRLRLKESERALERELEQQRLKSLAKKIRNVEEAIAHLDGKGDAGQKILKSMRQELDRHVDTYHTERKMIQVAEFNFIETISRFRKFVFQAEYKLRSIENRQARHREEYAAKREGLLTRLQQLENQTIHLEPADRLRGVERKLDALRREVGELRRTLERPKER